MNLILDYESSALAAPQSFLDAMQTAANILDATIQNNITVTIQVGYGDWDNGLLTGLGTSAVGGDLYGSYISYTTLRAALASHETSTLDQTFVNSLPNTASVNGVSGLYVPSSVEKALGLISPTASAIDGAIGIGAGIPTGDLVGVALHELTHAFGREPGAGTFDLLRYTSPGNHLFASGNTAPAAYFSIDGGVTKLADFGQTSDPADFLNSGVQGANDPLNEYYSASTSQQLSTVDKELLDALGFNVNMATPGTPSASTSSVVVSSPTVTADGTSTTSLTITVKDAQGNAVAGTAVTLSASGSSNNFGTFSGTTDAHGVFTTTLSSTLAQTETIIATEAGVQEQTSVSFVAGAPSATTSSIIANSSVVTADGTSTTNLTVTVKDAHGNAVAGTAVTLSGSGSANNFGAISGITNSNGVFSTTLASTLVQNEIITATEGSVLETTSVSFVPSAASATTSSMVASSPTLTADGTSTTTLTVTVLDAHGNAVAGTAVALSASGSSNAFGATSGTTNANGVFTTTLASTLAQNETITATEGSTQEHTSVSFVAGGASATTSSIVASSPTVTADGISATILTVTVEDAHGNAVANSAVTLSGSGASNSFGAISGTTNASGVFTTTLTSTLVQNETITATEGSVHETAAVSFVPAATVQTDGTTSLTEVGNNFYLYTNGVGSELKFGGSAYVAGEWGAWTPYGAVQTASGYDVAWKDASTGQYTVWAADSNGNWTSNLISNVSASDTSLQSIETTFHQDLNGDGIVGLPVAVVQTNGTTSLTEVGSNFYLYNNGMGPELKFAGSTYVAGEWGAWTPYGAVQTASGYDVAWKDASTGQYTVWTADSNGNWITNLISNVSASDTSLQSIETTFHQDLNGDGTIGVPTIAIQPNAETNLVEIGSNYYLYTNGAGPELTFGGSAYVAGQWGAWTPYGAVETASGYDVAWKDASTGQYTVWTADSGGHWTSNLISNVSASDASLQSIETTFHQDLNGDGIIGLPPATVIQTDGTTSLAEAGNNFYLYTNGAGPELTFGASAYVAGQWGAWTPYGAVETASGYDVAWKDASTGQYTVWTADSSGNWISNLISNVSASDTSLQSIETTFHQDLNGDGIIGVPTILIQPNAPTSLAEIGSNYYLYTNATGVGPELKFAGSPYVAGEWGAWTPYAAVQTASGFDVAWKDASSGQYTVWTADSNGNWISNLISNVSASDTSLQSIETTFHQDLNGDGLIGVPTPAGTTPAATNIADGNQANAFVAAANEIFVFSSTFGQAAIANFSLETDIIQFSKATFADISTLLAATHNDGHGNSMIIDAANDILTIQNVTAEQLAAHQSAFHIV